MQTKRKFFILGLAVATVMIMLLQLRTTSISAAAPTYFVDSKGNDDNAGTKKSPGERSSMQQTPQNRAARCM